MFAIHRGWLLATAGLMLLFGAVYLGRHQLPLFANERVSVYTFGILGFALILFLSNYASRKYIFLWFGGKLRLWLLAHIYLSLLAARRSCITSTSVANKFATSTSPQT